MVIWTVKPASVRSMICADIVGTLREKRRGSPEFYFESPSKSTSIVGHTRADLWIALDEATKAGEGIATLNLSPYGAVISALVRKFGPSLFDPLAKSDNRKS